MSDSVLSASLYSKDINSNDARPPAAIPTLSDWIGIVNPSGSYVFGVNGFLYSMEQLDSNFNNNEEPIMLTHNNILARNTGPSGMDLDPSNASDFPYIIPNWGGALQYGQTAWTLDATNSGYFGRDYDTDGLTTVTLAELPPRDIPLLSLGWLQHARLMENNLGPSFTIGNSMPNVYMANLTALERDNDINYDADDNRPAAIDATYLLNDALWDPFFLSTIENPTLLNDETANNFDGPDYYAPNSRVRRYDYREDIPADQLADFFDFAAANLMVEGAFNVNSVDVGAWKAFLGSLGKLAIDPETGGAINGNEINRLVTHLASPTEDDDVTTRTDVWNGYRSLDDAELTSLAEAMVEQVKERGPFFSLSEFVNRRLSDDATGQRGALQAAIDASTVNDTLLNSGDVGANRQTTSLPDPFLQAGSGGYHYDAVTGWITQGDLLQALGPFLSARSDTFLIRSYGDAVDPLTGDINGKAWCEAIVQRMPTPVVRASNNEDDPNYFEPANPDRLGRQFKVVAFRWLSADQI